MLTRLDAILNIRLEERRTVYLMLAQYFFMGAAMLFAQTASMPLFLEYWDPSAIPFTYIGIAVIVSSITAVFLKISERVSLSRWLFLTVLFLVLATLGFWLGLLVVPSKWLALSLPIWTQTLVNLAVLAFWTLAADVFDVRQGKRLFGLLNAGSWLSYVVAGPFSGRIAQGLGTENLYAVIAVCLFVALLLQGVLLRGSKQAQPVTTVEAPPQPPLSALFKNRYILLIFALAAIWRVSYFVLDAIFYNATSAQFSDTAGNAGFIGGFFSAVGLLGFITDTFLTGRIISRFGLWAGLLTTPLALILAMSGFAAVGVVAPAWTVGLFWFAIAGKFNNEGLGFTLDQSASSILYQPISDALRPRARAIGEGIVQPAAIGIAGLLLTVLGNGFQFGSLQFSYVYLVLAIIWLGLSVVLARSYSGVLIEALEKRRISRNELLNVVEVNEHVLVRGVTSPYAGTVLYSLDLLEEIRHPRYATTLVHLVDHESAQVRQVVMERIERVQPEAAGQVVGRRLDVEEHSDVRFSGVRAFAALHAHDVKVILPYLESKREADRHGALIGLAKYGGAEGFAYSERHLRALVHDANESQRALAATLIGELSNENLNDSLSDLLADKSLVVRKAAIVSAGRRKVFIPQLIEMLSLLETRSAAMRGLELAGEAALPEISATLRDLAVPRAVRIKLAQVCGRIGTPVAQQVLVAHINDGDSVVRSTALAGLAGCGFSGDSIRGEIQAQALKEAGEASAWLAALQDVSSTEGTGMLVTALRREVWQARERIFLLFELIHDRRAVANARRVIAANDSAKIPFAIETLDTVLPRSAKQLLLPLAEDLPADETLARLNLRTTTLEPRARIEELAQLDMWVGMCATAYLKGVNVYSIVEKVLILKSLNLFSRVPDDALAEVAEALTTLDVPAGTEIVEKGEAGDSMFVIVHGRVSVRDGERVLNTLNEREVFGELSLLDAEPRTASVRAEVDTVLFKLEQTAFYEVLADRTEIALGTIQMLTKNLRARVKDVIELQARVLPESKDT